MLRWLESRFDTKKAQFFIISTVILALSLTAISNNLKGYGDVDMSQVAQENERDVFLNVKNQAKSVINSSNCPEAEIKLKDFRNYVTQELRSRNIDFSMEISDSCPEPITVSMNLTSSDIIIRDRFTYP